MEILVYDQFKSDVNHTGLSEGKIYKEGNISVHVNPTDDRGEGFTKEIYIKVYNAPNSTSATEEMRISMKDARVIHHKQGKKEMKMTKKLGKQLNSIMKRQSTESRYKSMTVYDAIYKAVEDANVGKKNIEVKKFPVPDFTKFYDDDDKNQ